MAGGWSSRILAVVTVVPERVAGAVLAAGSGSRMGRPKADVVVGGVRLLDRAIAAMGAAGCAPLWAVVRDGTRVDGADAVVNPDPARGMRSSLTLAVEAAAAAGSGVLAVLLVDVPGIDADAIARVVSSRRPARIAVARYAGRRGHPIVMPVALWLDALALAAPDEGARALLRDRPDLVDDIDVVGDPTDLDTPDDLARWTGSIS